MVAVCLTTKAVHLEVVEDLSGNNTLNALLRMMARRGRPQLIISDNGTNLRYAEKEIGKIIEKQQKMAKNEIVVSGIDWHFTPPKAPNFNGLAEAAVKAVKKHLIPLVEKTRRTFPEFNTLLICIEAILNCRPLCKYGGDILTPGHFLIGRHLKQVPLPLATAKTYPPGEDFKLMSKLAQEFWDAWRNEIWKKLDKRYRWQVAKKNIGIGDIVIIKDEQTAPGEWPLAKVTEVLPGKDGLVRVCRMLVGKTGKTMERSVRNLIVLPVRPEIVEQYDYIREFDELLDEEETPQTSTKKQKISLEDYRSRGQKSTDENERE